VSINRVSALLIVLAALNCVSTISTSLKSILIAQNMETSPLDYKIMGFYEWVEKGTSRNDGEAMDGENVE
jgi:hypothetical protein